VVTYDGTGQEQRGGTQELVKLKSMKGRQKSVETEERGSDTSVKQVLVVVGLVFAITLAVVVGKQMSTEAMAVVIGVVCGVAAGIPTSLLLMLALTHRDRQRVEQADPSHRQGSYPPVVIIQGGAPQALPLGSQAGYWPAPAPSPIVQRQFHVVGDDDRIWNG
jgi:hypothetical protein